MSVMDEKMTLGMLVAFGSFSTQFASRMSALIDSSIGFRMLTVHAERLADIVLEPPEFEGEATTSIPRLEPRIELINVGYRYSQSDSWIIKNFSLTIEPGESIVFTGPSGCGKTTLIKLIIGAIQPTEGEIRYGGIPIHNLGPRQYRNLFAAVMQDDQLLAGSIRENISSFAQNADQNHIKSCAKAAALDNELSAMPMGYDTLVGELGTTLSGGQKQRVFLARALYKNPKVLVLDEATSNLDVTSEQKINSAISILNITRIIAAHRRETIESAERVIYLDKGMIQLDVINRTPKNISVD
jgi:ATP-binding cassette subfamily B protein RaxB